jgi:DNA-binding transcriptional LysR family regulator
LLLGASTTIAEFFLPQILGEFKALHPLVQARMTVGNSEVIERRVAEHALDIGLIESASHLPGLQTEVCCEDVLVMICSPKYKLAKAKRVSAAEIAGEPFISREPGSGTREFADQYFQQNKIAPDAINVVMELGSPEAIKGVVATGLGVSILSRATVAKELKLGVLVAVPLDPPLIRGLSVVTPRDKFRSRLLTTFAEFAVARMKEMAAAR